MANKNKGDAPWLQIVLGLIAAAGLAAAAYFGNKPDKPPVVEKPPTPTPTSSSPQPPAPSPTPTPTPTAAATKPAEPTISLDSVSLRGRHKGISVADGIQARGRVQNLPDGHTLWLMDRDVKGYTIDQPVKRSGQTWTAESHPLGDEGTRVPLR